MFGVSRRSSSRCDLDCRKACQGLFLRGALTGFADRSRLEAAWACGYKGCLKEDAPIWCAGMRGSWGRGRDNVGLCGWGPSRATTKLGTLV